MIGLATFVNCAISVVAHVAINVFTNYFNIAFETEIDFPVVRTQQAKAA
jgi:hypothetical protein